MSSRSRMNICVCLLSAAALMPAGANAFQGDNGNERFAEQPGYQEFSGSMIARPWPTFRWIEQGMTVDEAQRQYDEAVRLITAIAPPRVHVWQTDQYIFDLPQGMTENDVAHRLLATGLFKFAEPNWRVYPQECPNDAQFGSQWYHGIDRYDSCAGWDIHTGTPEVTVGVCDTGVRFTHEDLQLHRQEGYNAVDRLWESNGGQINDIYGHGTESTGCAAANGNNGIGVTGMGWNLSHRMLRVTNSPGGGSSIEWLNHAAVTAIESGDKVASLSYSGVDNQAVRDTATYIKSIGGLMIWAAGNSSQNMTTNDRDADDVIIVGAVSRQDVKSSFSNYGRMVDLVAPGEEVWNVSSGGDNQYRNFSGTSAACPQVSGLAALLWSTNPALTPDEVEFYLKSTCNDLGAPGIDDTYGYGRINLHNAVAAAFSGEIPMLLRTSRFVSGVNGDAEVFRATPGQLVAFVYSVRGLGNTYITQLDVTLGIASPALAGTRTADQDGYALLRKRLPPGTQGRHVWMQAAEFQRASNVVEVVIE